MTWKIRGAGWRRLAAVLILLALAARAVWAPHRQPPEPAATRPTATDPAPAPAAHWRLGQLDLQACALPLAGSGLSTPAWCGQLRVPENRARPGGRQITLRLAVIRADTTTTASDMVTILAGGPGQAATAVWPPMAAALQGLRKHRNILLLDQRGTGGSHPLRCPPADPASTAQADDPASWQAQARNCAQQLAADSDLRQYTTTVAVQDLEQVRQALGAPPLDLIGISYGTRMAQHYAETYPAAVRSLILDGVVPDTLVLGQDTASNLDAALRAQSQRCEQQPACRQRFGQPYASLRLLQQQLSQHPLHASLHDPYRYQLETRTLEANSLAGVARLFAYSPLTAALLPLSVDAALHGDATPLLAQAQLIQGELQQGIDMGMSYAVSCSEDADLLQDRAQDADTVLGRGFVRTLKQICAIWPSGSRPPGFHRPFHSDLPVLLLSGQFDPVTPPRYAAEVAAGLSHARQLLLPGQGHHVLLAGCMPRLAVEFITHPDPAALDASCLQRLQAPAFFTSFNGAQP